MDLEELSGWGISKQIAEVIENGFSYDEETGEVFFTTDDLDALNETLDNKIDSIAGMHLKYLASSESLKIRSQEILKSSKTQAKKAESLKRYIDALMKLNGKTKLEVGDKKISYRKSTSGNITDEVKLMKFINSSQENKDKYLKYKEPEIAKQELVKAVKNGEEIDGFELSENNNIQVKNI